MQIRKHQRMIIMGTKEMNFSPRRTGYCPLYLVSSHMINFFLWFYFFFVIIISFFEDEEKVLSFPISHPPSLKNQKGVSSYYFKHQCQKIGCQVYIDESKVDILNFIWPSSKFRNVQRRLYFKSDKDKDDKDLVDIDMASSDNQKENFFSNLSEGEKVAMDEGREERRRRVDEGKCNTLPYTEKLKSFLDSMLPIESRGKQSIKKADKLITTPCFRLFYNDEKQNYEFQTSISKYFYDESKMNKGTNINSEKSGINQPLFSFPIEIDLISMVHVGEKDYFDRLLQRCNKEGNYDFILYELITTKENTKIEAEQEYFLTSDHSITRNAVKTESIVNSTRITLNEQDRLRESLEDFVTLSTPLGPTQSMINMAQSHNLLPQLDCIDYAAMNKKKWILSDIEKETLVNIERWNREKKDFESRQEDKVTTNQQQMRQKEFLPSDKESNEKQTPFISSILPSSVMEHLQELNQILFLGYAMDDEGRLFTGTSFFDPESSYDSKTRSKRRNEINKNDDISRQNEGKKDIVIDQNIISYDGLPSFAYIDDYQTSKIKERDYFYNKQDQEGTPNFRKKITTTNKKINAAFSSTFRLLLWLTPCPELEVMLFDWARRYPPSGGISSLFFSFLSALSNLDLFSLRRIVFAQFLTSSQTTSTSLKDGKPLEEILVSERNNKVLCDILSLLKRYERVTTNNLSLTRKRNELSDGKNKAMEEKPLRLAVLYGGLHMSDLEQKLQSLLQMKPRSRSSNNNNYMREGSVSNSSASFDGTEWETAWSMPALNIETFFDRISIQSTNVKTEHHDQNEQEIKGLEVTDRSNKLQLIKVGVLSLFLPILYLYIDGQDWTTTFLNTAVLVKDMATHLPLDDNQDFGIFLEDTKDLFYLLSTYLLRHVYIYFGLTKWLIQWDKRLFDLEGDNDIYRSK